MHKYRIIPKNIAYGREARYNIKNKIGLPLSSEEISFNNFKIQTIYNQNFDLKTYSISDLENWKNKYLDHDSIHSMLKDISEKQKGNDGLSLNEILKFATRPDSIYSGVLRKILFSFVPMAMISSIPVRMLLFGPNIKYLIGQLFITTLFLILSRIIWERGLIRYESASS